MGSLLKQKFLNIINRDNEKEVKYLRTLHEIFIKIKRPFLLLFIPILLLLLMEIYFYKFSPDDTYIVLRYAHNLFLGNGQHIIQTENQLKDTHVFYGCCTHR